MLLLNVLLCFQNNELCTYLAIVFALFHCGPCPKILLPCLDLLTIVSVLLCHSTINVFDLGELS